MAGGCCCGPFYATGRPRTCANISIVKPSYVQQRCIGAVASWVFGPLERRPLVPSVGVEIRSEQTRLVLPFEAEFWAPGVICASPGCGQRGHGREVIAWHLDGSMASHAFVHSTKCSPSKAHSMWRGKWAPCTLRMSLMRRAVFAHPWYHRDCRCCLVVRVRA